MQEASLHQRQIVQAQCQKNAMGDSLLQEKGRKVQRQALQKQQIDPMGKRKMAHQFAEKIEGKIALFTRQSVEEFVKGPGTTHQRIEEKRIQPGKAICEAAQGRGQRCQALS
jgi:hypothetical protein